MKLHSLLAHSPRAALLGAITLAATAATGDAALITWGAPQNITGDSDVSTNGTLVDAFNLHGVNTTVNGVLFTGMSTLGGTTPTFSFGAPLNSIGSTTVFSPFGTLSNSYRSLLATGGSGVFLSNSLTAVLTISGLTIGETYEFQFWGNTTGAGFGATLTASTGVNSVTLDNNVQNFAGGMGQFALGTFVADSVTQTVSFQSSETFAILNGAQLRLLPPPAAAVPEPGTALAGLVLAGFCSTLRRRRTV